VSFFFFFFLMTTEFPMEVSLQSLAGLVSSHLAV